MKQKITYEIICAYPDITDVIRDIVNEAHSCGFNGCVDHPKVDFADQIVEIVYKLLHPEKYEK